MNLDELNRQFKHDQAEAGIEGLAGLVRAYYAELTKGGELSRGLPPALAADLLRDWHRLMITKSLWPNGLGLEGEG